MLLKSNLDVNSPNIFLRGRNTFDPAGLFSEQIFGNVKDYQCQCGKFFGIKYMGKRCDDCNVLIGPSSIRNYILSKIILPLKIPNPLYCIYNLPVNLLTQLKNSKDESIIEEIEDYLKKKIIEKDGFDLFIDQIIVLPPTLRNIRKIGKKNIEIDKLNYFYISILNYISKYKNSIIGNEPSNLINFTKLYLTRMSMKLYSYVIQLLTKKEGMIRQSVLGKRNDFTGRAVITIDPTLDINEAKISYRILAGLFFSKLLNRMTTEEYDSIEAYLILKKYINNTNSVNPIDAQKIESIIDKIQQDKYILLNRQPTLHRVSIQAFKPIGIKEDVISIPPEVCAAFNADFDGDTMATYIPLTDFAKKEVEEYMDSKKQLLLPGLLSFKGFTQDFVLGTYYVTNKINDNEPIEIIESDNLSQIKKLHPHTKIKIQNIITSAGRYYIMKLFNNFNLVFPLSSSKIKMLLNSFLHKNYIKSQDDYLNSVNKVKELRDYVIPYTVNYTLSIEDFLMQEELEKEKEKYLNEKNWNTQIINDLNEDIKLWTKNLKLTDNISQIITSGARGNLRQLIQTVGLRGFVRNTSGKFVTPPILSSLREGYSPLEIILSSTGNRKGVIDKALNTATSGYLTRKLVFSLQHLILTNIDDCGTNQGITVTITKDNFETYLFRNTLDGQVILYENIDKFIGKTITLRSPIYCKVKDGICKRCYHLYDYKSKLIGIIAAQSIGEPGTQMVMRSFHTGGAADIKTLNLPTNLFYSDENDIYYISQNCIITSENEDLPIKDNILLEDILFIISCGDNIFEVTLPKETIFLLDKKFIGTPIKKGTAIFKQVISTTDLATDLNIVDKNLGSTLKLQFKDAIDLLNILKEVYSQYQSILSIHFELLWSERLRTLDGNYVRLLNEIKDDMHVYLASISSIPHSRLLLSLCFEDFRKFFKGFLKSSEFTYSPLECLIQSNIDKLREIL